MITATQSPEALAAAAAEIQEETYTEYLTLARRAAHDEVISPAEVARIATAAGRPIAEYPSEFPQLVERFKHRRLLRAKIARLEPVEKEMTEARAAVDKENAELELHVAHHQRVCAPLQARLRELRAEFADGASTSSELIGSCPDPRLKRRSRQIQAEIERLTLGRMRAADKAEECRGRAKHAEEQGERLAMERAADAAEAELRKLITAIEKVTADQRANTQKILEA